MYCPFYWSIYCVIKNQKRPMFYQNYWSYWSRTDCASGRRHLSLWYKPPVFHKDSWSKRSCLGVWGSPHLQYRRNLQNTVLPRGRIIFKNYLFKKTTFRKQLRALELGRCDPELLVSWGEIWDAVDFSHMILFIHWAIISLAVLD